MDGRLGRLPARLLRVFVILALVSSFIVFGGARKAFACIVDADNDCYLHVTGTVSSANLNVRAAPWGQILDNVPNGYSSSVDCYVQAPDGSYWDWLYDSRIGRSGWVYDPYLYTGGNIYQQVDELHEGNCATIPVTTPTNIAATAISSGAIRVTWTDTNFAVANYVVINGNTASSDLAPGTTSYTWGGLAPNTYMCFAVAAKAYGQQSPYTPWACATTWPLKAPSNVTATPTGTNSVRVSWSDTDGGAAAFVVNNGNVSSSDLSSSTNHYDWGGLAPNTYMCFQVAAKQSGQQSPWSSPYACTTTYNYVNMGDSFSAGEGTYGPYDSGTDTSTDKCHRDSVRGLSGQFASRSSHWKVVKNIACSGAVTSDITIAPGNTNTMSMPTAGEPAQTSVLNGNTGLVTVTIGGNNLDLADVFAKCYKLQNHDQTNTCFINSFSDSWISGIQNLLDNTSYIGTHADPSVPSTYTSIRNAAPHARIVVSTYPQTYPATYTGDCNEGIGPTALYIITSQQQLTQIRKMVSTMNQVIKADAQAAGFTVVDEENKFKGHELCTSSSWVNMINGYVNFSGTEDDESLHPTSAGYQQWGSDIAAQIG